ncbi:TIGR04219 family outer membrane beta-barrel protein [Catenovulum sediminis]|uniref:TIGR04219 family outer membrane beta-barrel protein n=1 Tax=Catenovulum sediminis TaxID=1740262 RepID=A0ABV1RDL8_9ALTE|nr:TIGR04219 family outer membrane beta-barrel protein [Catenovulum sediminis]
MKSQSTLKLAIAAACLAASSTAHADMILGLYAGAQYWNIEPEGQFGTEQDDQETFNFDSTANASFYAALEHPIPLVPNLKVRHNQMDGLSGNGTVDGTFTFGGETYQSSTDVMVDADLTNTDYTLYYEIFDNGLVSFDFGVNVKHIDAIINAEGNTQSGTGNNRETATEEFSGYVPMGYVAAAIGLPLTGLSVYGDFSLLAIGDHSLSDYQVGVAYEFIDNLAVDMSVQAGYRSFALELDDLEGIYTDLDFAGFYAGLEVHF